MARVGAALKAQYTRRESPHVSSQCFLVFFWCFGENCLKQRDSLLISGFFRIRSVFFGMLTLRIIKWRIIEAFQGLEGTKKSFERFL